MEKKGSAGSLLKRYGCAVAAAILLTAVVMGISILSRRDFLTGYEMVDGRSVRSEIYPEAEGASLQKKRVYTVETEDPHLYIGMVPEEIRSFGIQLASPLPEGEDAQLYYIPDGGEISEDQSVRILSDGVRTRYDFELPAKGIYLYFRLDISADCEIEDYYISGEPLRVIVTSYWEMIRTGRQPFPKKQTAGTLLIMLLQCLGLAYFGPELRQWLREKRAGAGERRRSLGIGLGLWAAGVVLAALVWLIFLRSDAAGNRHLLDYGGLYILLCGSLAGGLAAMRKQAVTRPWRLFFWVGLHIGLVFVLLEPIATNISWDDQVHYTGATVVAYGGNRYLTDAEIRLTNYMMSTELNAETMLETRSFLTAADQLPMSYSYVDAMGLHTVPGYLPAAAGIWIARALGLPFPLVVIAGRLANLLTYLGVMALAIRQLRRGRMVLALLGLLPTVLFMAGNFSYDPVCIAGLALGSAMFMRMYQEPAGVRHPALYLTGLLCAFILGSLSKPIYIPAVLIALLLPAAAFTGKKQKWSFRAGVLLSVVLVAASAYLYVFVQRQGAGDIRVMGTASSSGQVAFILSDPLGYLGILFRFLFEKYFVPSALLDPVSGCVGALAYLVGRGVSYTTVHIRIMLVLALAGMLLAAEPERRELGPVRWPVRVWGTLLAFGVVALAATSMYCAFTEVGAKSIGGCQARYILPAFLPLMAMIGPRRPLLRIPQGVLRMLLFVGMAAVCMHGLWGFAAAFL